MKTWENLFILLNQSLPVQLLVRHVQHYRLLLFFWLLVLGLQTGLVGKNFGGAFLFLEPEYQGSESYLSILLVGAALGMFLFAYTITLYINESYRFHFIALDPNPFFTFALNNFLTPGLFLAVYFSTFSAYQVRTNGLTLETAGNILSLMLGLAVVFVVSATYFFARRGFLYRFGKQLERRLGSNPGPHKRRVILERARESFRRPQDTAFFLSLPLRIALVDPDDHSSFREIVRALNQHHGRLLIFQVLVFAMIGGLGILDTRNNFQLPAGASFLLIFSLALLVLGALAFWFRRAGILTVAAVAGIIWLYNQTSWFQERNHAFGMDYTAAPVPYTEAQLAGLTQPDSLQADRARTLAMLEAWKDRYQAEYGPKARPRAIFVMSSGGGLRSAYWTMQVLMQLDSTTGGRATDEIRLMTGASGGMFGQAYFREWMLRKSGEAGSLGLTEQEAANVSKDVLNRILFRNVTDVLFPHRQVQVGRHTYDRETGYAFDDQIAQNLPELAGRRLGHYAAAEQAGLIPPLILTPTIINQGRPLYVSSNPVSFLSRPNPITDSYDSKAYGVEFRRLFSRHEPDSLLMTTALRMNATFPIVLPLVELPSTPVMEVMDAGAIDNYGTRTSLRYLFEFHDWFEANTRGVVFLQIRDNNRKDPIKGASKTGLLGAIFAPLSGGLYSMAESKDMSNDYLLEFVQEWYRGPVEVITVEYPRESERHTASLSWHLTHREKADIRAALRQPHNQQAFSALSALFRPRLLARRER